MSFSKPIPNSFDGVHHFSPENVNPLWRAVWDNGVIDSYSHITDVYNKHFINQTASISDEDLLIHIESFVSKYRNKKLLKKLQRRNRKLFRDAPEHVKIVSGHINVATILHVMETEDRFEDHLTKDGASYPDSEICNHLSSGFPDHGGTFKSGIFDEIEFVDLDPTSKSISSKNELRRHRVLYEEYHFTGKDLIMHMHELEPHWQPDMINQKVWSNTLKELESGIMRGPFTASKALAEMRRLGHHDVTVSTLFGVHQPKESDPDRCRSVLNMVDVNDQSYLSEHFVFPNHCEIPKWIIYSSHRGRKYLLNPKIRRKIIYEAIERVRPMKQAQQPSDIETPLRDARVARDELLNAAASTGTFHDLSFVIMDFKAAYRQICCQSLNTNWVKVWNPAKSRYDFVLALACQFGSIHSVSSWVRTSELVVSLLRRKLGINAIVYIDDVIMLIPTSIVEKVTLLVREFVGDILGFRLDTDKEFIGKSAKILGIVYDIDRFGGTMTCEQKRIAKVITDISHLRARILSPKLASSVTWLELSKIIGLAIFIAMADQSIDISYWAINCSGALPYEAIVKARYSKRVPLLLPGRSRMITEQGLPDFALADRLNNLVEALRRYSPFRFCAPTPDTHFVYAFTDASASEEESSIGWQWLATDVYGKSVKQNAVRVQLDQITKESFRRSSTGDDSDPPMVDIRLAETAALCCCARNITTEITNPVIFSNVDNLCTVFGVNGRKVSCVRMLKLVQIVLREFNIMGLALPVSYVPTNLNPSDGLTRDNLLEKWHATFPDVKLRIESPLILRVFIGYDASDVIHKRQYRHVKKLEQSKQRKGR
jgi:hypothetical protein